MVAPEIWSLCAVHNLCNCLQRLWGERASLAKQAQGQMEASLTDG